MFTRAALMSAVFALAPAMAAPMPGASFAVIDETLGEIAATPGTKGAALIIGKGDTLFHTRDIGGAGPETRIELPRHADIAGATLLYALIDTGFIGIDDPARDYIDMGEDGRLSPTTVRMLMIARHSTAVGASAKATATLTAIAEAATTRSWNELFDDWIAAPTGLSATRYPLAPGRTANLDGLAPKGSVETTARDYARILSLYTDDGLIEGVQVLSPAMLDLAAMRQIVGEEGCIAEAIGTECQTIETSADGLFAFIDRERGLYGVIAAPGAKEAVIAEKGRLVRQLASAIDDAYTDSPAGLTSATRSGAN